MDVAEIVTAVPDLFEEKVAWVSIMGGLQQTEDGRWEPDSAQNNVFDEEAARIVYDFCFQRCIPMSVMSRDAVPMIPMQLARNFYEENPDDVLFRYLYQVQTLGLEALWRKVCNNLLPPRCTKEV